MSRPTNEVGLGVFVGDWLRSQPLRAFVQSPNHSYADVVKLLREQYLLSDRSVGIVVRRDRGDLMAEEVRCLAKTDLDSPDPWGGCVAPLGYAPASSTTSSRTATSGSAADSNRRNVGWPGVAIVCLESVTRKGMPAVLAAEETAELEVTGWNLKSPVDLSLVLDESPQVKLNSVPVSTDEWGRSVGKFSVRLPATGLWSVQLDHQGDARSSLEDAIEVKATS